MSWFAVLGTVAGVLAGYATIGGVFRFWWARDRTRLNECPGEVIGALWPIVAIAGGVFGLVWAVFVLPSAAVAKLLGRLEVRAKARAKEDPREKCCDDFPSARVVK